jgi:hypothetical protein
MINARLSFIALALCAALLAGEKKPQKPAQGMVEDDTVTITATILTRVEVIEAVGSDFDNDLTVLDVRVAPKDGKPYEIKLDDFILRSEASGDHSGPFDSADEIAGKGALQVTRIYGQRTDPDSARPIEGTKLAMNQREQANPALAAVRQKMLTNKTITGPVSGLMFFPLSSKEKAKHLILSCQTPQSKLRLSFKQ